MRDQLPVSWIVFLFITGFVCIGYGAHEKSQVSSTEAIVSATQ